ncbi:hypothetical protein C7S14_7299 [Burkholderia cepacia]|nr:hypothetical protein C7S14_7299 [Burkholderia cepacia]
MSIDRLQLRAVDLWNPVVVPPAAYPVLRHGVPTWLHLPHLPRSPRRVPGPSVTNPEETRR